MTVRLWALPPNAKTIAVVNANGNLYVTQNFDNPAGPTWSTGLQLVDTSQVGPIDQFTVDPFSPGYLSNDPNDVINGWFTTAGKPRRPGPEVGGGLYRITDIFGATPGVSLKFTFTFAAYSYAGTGAGGRNLKVSPAFDGWLAVLTHYQEDGTYLVYTLDGGLTWPGGENLINARVESSENTYNHTPGLWLSSKTQGKAWLAAYKVGGVKNQAQGGLYEVQMSASGISGTDTPITDPDLDLANGLGEEFHAPYHDNPQENIFYYGKKVILPPWDQANYLYRSIGTSKQNIAPIKSGEPHGRPMPNGGISTHVTDQGRILLCGRYNGGDIYTVFVSGNGGANWNEAPFNTNDYAKDKYWRGQIASDGQALYFWGLGGTIGYSPDFAGTTPVDRRGNLSTTGHFIALISQTVIDASEPAHDGDCACPFYYAGNDCANTTNPVSLRKGEKRLEVTDLSLNTPAGPLTFTRQYRQSKQEDADFQQLGLGWMHNHAVQLKINGNAAQVVLGNGGILKLFRTTATQFKADTGSNSVMDLANNEWTLTAPDGSAYTFEDAGGGTWQVKSRTWANGEAWSYHYEADAQRYDYGKLKVVNDGYNGRQLQFAYYHEGDFRDGRLRYVGDQDANLEVTPPTGRVIELDYVQERLNGQVVNDPRLLLRQVTDARENDWLYDYYGQDGGENDPNLANFLVERQSPAVDTDGDEQADGTLILEQLAYTVAGGRITGITQQRGGGLLTTGLAFDEVGPNNEQQTTETVAGKSTKHFFKLGVYAGAENPLGETARQNPNGQFRAESQLDANGNETLLGWSADGRQLEQVADALNHTTEFHYNSADGTLDYSLDSEGRKTQYVYGATPRQPTEVKVIDSDGTTVLRWQKFVYDSKGRTLEEKTVDPSDGDTELQKIIRAYYPAPPPEETAELGAGLLESVTQVYIGATGNDETTTYFYDSSGRVIKTQKTSLLGTCEFSYTVYDESDQVVGTVCSRENTTAPTTIAEALAMYDANDPVRQHTRVTTHVYDALGRRVKTTANANTSFEQVTWTFYDALNRVWRTIDRYQPQGTSAPGGWVWEDGVWKDGPQGVLISHGTDDSQNIISDTEYDMRGLVRLRRDVLGHATRYVYDDAGRLVRTIASFVPQYDAQQREAEPEQWFWDESETQWKGAIPNDPPASPTLIVIGHGADNDQNIITEQSYDAASNLVMTRDSTGSRTFSIYDPLNRPVRIVRSAKAAATIAYEPGDPNYVADNDPRLPSEGLPGEVYLPSLDPDRDLIQETVYDDAGRVVQTRRLLENRGEAPQWDVTRYVYDSLDRQVRTIANFVDQGEAPSLWTWDDAEEQKRWELSDGTPIDHGNNDRNLITETAYDDAGRVLWTRDVEGGQTYHVYDGFGRRVKTVANYYPQGPDPANWEWVTDHWENGSGQEINHGSSDRNIITETAYDADGRVYETRDVEGKVTRSVYDGQGRQVKTITNFVPQYDEQQREALPEDWYWDETAALWKGEIANDPPDLPTIVVISHGAGSDENIISDTEYDSQGRVQKTRDVRGNLALYGYDTAGRQIRTIQNASNTSYDVDGDPTLDSYTPAIGAGDDQDRITTTRYDLAGRMVGVVDAAGAAAYYVYDALGRRTRTVNNYVDTQGGIPPENWLWSDTHRRWEDGSGAAIVHGTAFDQNLVSETSYNPTGQIMTTRDARGTQTAFGYDQAGRRRQVDQAAGNPFKTTVYTCYDKAGRVLRTIANWTGEGLPDEQDTNGNWPFAPGYHDGGNNDRNRIVAYVYDAASRHVKVTDPVGNETTTTYFKDGQVDTVTDPEGVLTLYRYDGLRRRYRVVQGYEWNGEDPSKWYADTNVTPPRWKKSDGTPIEHGSDHDRNVIAQVVYDLAGRQIGLLDPRAYETGYAYDRLGRRTQVTNPLSKSWVTSYSHAAGGMRVELVDPRGFTTQRDFDRFGRPRAIRYLGESPKLTPDVTFTYNAAGDRETMAEQGSSGDVRITEFGYDAARRLTGVGFNTDGQGGVDETVSYAYDLGGLRTLLTLPGALNITYAYDARGRLVSLTDWNNQQTRFGYDRADRLVAVDRANGLTSRCRYDAAGRLRLLRHTLGARTLAHFAYEVDRRGNRTQAFELLARPATTSDEVYVFDDERIAFHGPWAAAAPFMAATGFSASLTLAFLGREATLTVGIGPDHGIFDVYVSGSLWRSFDGYAAASGERDITLALAGEGPHLLELRSRADHNRASSGYVLRFKQLVVPDMAYDLRTIRYAYDRLSRVTGARYYPGVNTLLTDDLLPQWYAFTYDEAGNRAAQTLRRYNVVDPVLTVSHTYNPANQVEGFTYDDSGNLMSDGVNTYTWDRANRLLGMGGITYAYDGLGSRVSQTVSGIITRYLLDYQPSLVKVLTATTGTDIERYVFDPLGIHTLQDSNGDWKHILRDGLSSARMVVDDTVNVNSIEHYAPYGEPLEPGAFGSPFGFTGEMTDANGLVYLRNRYYAPALGVFPSLDPMECHEQQIALLNRYGYVMGNPGNRVDPTGMFLETPWNGCNYKLPQQETSGCFIGKTPVDATTLSIIYTAAYGEIRQGGSAALALSVAADMNKLRVGSSITGFGTDYGGVFEGVCGASGGLVLPDGSLNSSCVIGYVLQTASGQLPQSMGDQSLTSAGAAWYGIAHVLLQVLGHCQFNDGSFYYPIWGRSVGLEPKDIEAVQAIYNDPNMRIAMTFHASWEGEIDLLACCMREANRRDTYESEPGVFEPTDLDYLDYRYAAGAEKGVVVSTMGMVNAAPEFVAGPRAASSFNICEAENEDRPGEYLFSSRIRCECSKQFPLIPWRTDFTGIADCSALP